MLPLNKLVCITIGVLLVSCTPHLQKRKYSFITLFYTQTYYVKKDKIISVYGSSGHATKNEYTYTLTDSSVILYDHENIVREIKTNSIRNKILLDTSVYNGINNW